MRPAVIQTALCVFASMAIATEARAGGVDAGCTLGGIKLLGRVRVVDSFADIKIQIVTSFPDLKVKTVTSFPDACGKWQFVDSFPDFTVQFVDSFPDLKIAFVESFPGIP